ncbi:mannose-6-phosphate isomerase [Aureococcus anophagefferens]|nr:mannose-6-phosphate isomerase [Aureococcus anophagefferens]
MPYQPHDIDKCRSSVGILPSGTGLFKRVELNAFGPAAWLCWCDAPADVAARKCLVTPSARPRAGAPSPDASPPPSPPPPPRARAMAPPAPVRCAVPPSPPAAARPRGADRAPLPPRAARCGRAPATATASRCCPRPGASGPRFASRYGLASRGLEAVDSSETYGELWLGTHARGAASLDDGTPLSRWEGDLPWLLKVLSVGGARRRRAPDRRLAAELHGAAPDIYPDGNHKPKLVVALTPLEALAGFGGSELAACLRSNPEFAACVGPEAQLKLHLATDEASRTAAVKDVFASFMACDDAKAPPPPPAASRASSAGPSTAPRARSQYPGDRAAMAPFFLNYLLVAPGESFYVAPGEPHALVAGECLELAASSDNVVVAGLSDKRPVDLDALLPMLSYATGGPDVEFGAHLSSAPGSHTLRYAPDVADFELTVTSVDAGAACRLEALPVPSILLVVAGVGTTRSRPGPDGSSPRRKHMYDLAPGTALYVTEGAIHLYAVAPAASAGPLRFVRASENLDAWRARGSPRE